MVEEQDWTPFIVRAHDDFIPLEEIIEKFKLTHFQDPVTQELLEFDKIELQDLEVPHTIGFLRKSPLGKEWTAYIVSYLEGEKILHKIMAKRKK